MDAKRAADLYAQGRTLRQIGAELGVTATRWAINSALPASPCVAAVLPFTRLHTTDPGNSVTKA